MPNIVRFDCFEADLESGELRKRGVRIKLRDQAFQVLTYLLQHAGRVVTREDLHRRLWRGEVFVDFDNNLNIVVARLREALGDSAERPRYIETLPKRGYRFLAAVHETAQSHETAPSPRARLVVLPFLNLSGDPAQEYFSDAVTDEIITELASIAPQQLAVIARTTAMLYKVRPKDVVAIGRELSVDYVVEGSVRRNEETLAVNVQLIQASDQTHHFAKRYEAALRDIFTLQHRIAGDVAACLPAAAGSVRTGEGGAAQSRKPTTDLVAYNEYTQGRYQLAKGTAESGEIAKQHFEEAIARDPEFALAHDGLAELYWYQGYIGYVAPRQAFSAGIIHAVRSIEIDNTRAEPHALLGEFHKTLDYNWPEVHREMALALQLDPDSPLVRMRYAVSELMPQGRLDDAAAELERALELDPLSLLARFWLGIVLLLSRRLQQAIEEGQKLLDVDPNYYLAYFILGNAYRYLGKLDAALAAQRKALKLSNGAAWILGWLGLTFAYGGDDAAAREALDQLYSMAAISYVPSSSFGWIHLGLGEIDTAFEWLNRAVDERDQLMMPIKSYGFFDPIRSDPRFSALLRKMKLDL